MKQNDTLSSVKVYKTELIKFKFFYNINKLWVKVCIAICIGILYSLATTLFVKNTSLYTGGTSAFFFGVARLTQTICLMNGINESASTIIYNILFWGLYLLMNIPLFIIAYKFIGRKFAIISMSFLIVNQVCGFLFGLIPNFHIDIFGKTENVYTYLHEKYQIDTIVLDLKIFPNKDAFNSPADIMPWDWVSNISDTNRQYANTIINSSFIRSISLFVYAITFSFISAITFSILFILGGSSGGSDFITIWYSTKKQKEISKIYTIINGMFMIVGVILGSYITGVITWNQIVNDSKIGHNVDLNQIFKSNPFAGAEYFFSANLLASLCWVGINGLLIERLFPSSKIVECEVTSKIINIIDEKIFQANEKFSIIPIARRIPTDIKFVCSYFEFAQVLKQIKSIDPDALVISKFISDIDGTLGLYRNKFKD